MSEEKITMAIDTKKYGIRIHKGLFRQLGEPRNIQILVNPAERRIAIQAASNDYSGGRTHRIREKRMQSDHSYEIYSRVLVRKLQELAPEIEENHDYRLTGEAVPSRKLAIFSLDSLQRID